MIEDNPKMAELDELIDFCQKNKSIYIYGHQLVQKMISKYLWMSNIKIQGFILPEIKEGERINEPFSLFNLVAISKLSYIKKINTGVIISSDDSMYNQVIEMLKMIGIKKIFIISEWNKRTIVKKLFPRTIDQFFLEVNLADHCNLNCQCCDHFSPIASKMFLDYDQYVKDIKRLAHLTDGKIGLMKLQGGEPLLNDRVIDYIKVTRNFFPSSHICLFTDGVLLPKWGEYNDDKNIWKAVMEYDVEIRMTQYPIPLQLDRIINKAKEYDVPVTFDPPPFGKGGRLWIFSEIGALDYKGEKHSVKHPFDLAGLQDKYRWISCYQFNESIVLRDGKIYTCPMIPYAHYFNHFFNQNLEVKEDCFIDIYRVQSFQEIAEFCTRRTSFCNYCAVHKRYSRTWRQSNHDIEEWIL